MSIAITRLMPVLATTFVVATLAAAQGQPADTPASQTPEELASSIANTVRATMPTPDERRSAPISLESATSRENVVELRFVVRNADAFAKVKANAEQARRAFYCGPSRIGVLGQGVVFHEVVMLSGHNDQFDLTFDKSSCLPKPARADDETLAALALTVAKTERDQAAKPSNLPFRLTAAVARQGVVDLSFAVDAGAATWESRAAIFAFMSGYFCGRYRDSLLRGLVVHAVSGVKDGPLIVDLTIDQSKCQQGH